MGRTFFDFISEHPKSAFGIFIVLIIIIVLLLLLKIPITYKDFEVGKISEMNISDTSAASNPETLYVEVPIVKTLITNTQVEPNSEVVISQTNIDTSIIVRNAPANINTGTNNGIIGNNNEVKITSKAPQRKLDDSNKQVLLNLIRELKISKKLPDTILIEVFVIPAHDEANILAKEILAFLKTQNINVKNEVIESIRMPTPKGVEVSFYARHIAIWVGYQPEQ